MSDGLVQCSAASVKAPRPAKPEIKPLTPDQARMLIQTAREAGDRFDALYVLALHCGLPTGLREWTTGWRMSWTRPYEPTSRSYCCHFAISIA
jgi:hypothetical protein